MHSKIVGIGGRGKAWDTYRDCIGDVEFTKPSEFMQDTFQVYHANDKDEAGRSNVSLTGRMFEYCVAECLFQMGIGPFYYQARLKYVPNSQFDFVCFHDKWPNVLSCKASLRERYKQADLEGWALKQVHRKALVYLITADQHEATSVENKIYDGEVIGLDKCICVYSEQYDELLDILKSKDFHKATPIIPVDGKYTEVPPP